MDMAHGERCVVCALCSVFTFCVYTVQGFLKSSYRRKLYERSEGI